MAQVTEFKKVKVKLVGEDGNAFSIIGRVSRALKSAGYRDEATEFQHRAASQPSYDALLQLVLEYADEG
jgi:hypothetical protein